MPFLATNGLLRKSERVSSERVNECFAARQTIHFNFTTKGTKSTKITKVFLAMNDVSTPVNIRV